MKGFGAENEQAICSPDYHSVCKVTLGLCRRVQGKAFQRTGRKRHQQKRGRSSPPSLFGKQSQEEGHRNKGKAKIKLSVWEALVRHWTEVSEANQRADTSLRGEAGLCIACTPVMTETMTAHETTERDHKGRKERSETGPQGTHTVGKQEEEEESGQLKKHSKW